MGAYMAPTTAACRGCGVETAYRDIDTSVPICTPCQDRAEEGATMALHDDELAQHLAFMHGALSVKADPSLEDLTYRWLLSDTLFSLSLDQTWDATADADRAALEAKLAGKS